jgi:ferredoxin
MTVDRPIDFGLQDFCERCNKCARECPCNAIPFGPKVMFNGYEMWKPDVEKCAKYRVTNAKGSACGRCMKTCPYNTEGLLAHRLFLWLAINVPWSRGWIARLDDKVGNGAINRAKKWWFDLEMVDGVSVTPKGVNERGLDLDAVKRAKTQALALFPPEVSPPPGARDPVEPDRAAGIKAYASAESPAAARARVARR